MLRRYTLSAVSFAARADRRLRELVRRRVYAMLAVCGHHEFVPFIVLSRSRTGSNLLLSYINSHPNARSEGEIFAQVRGKNCLDILADAFGKQPRHINAKGFKLFYYHPLDANRDQTSCLWDSLERNLNIHIIHLVRKNKLRTITSRKIAEKQNLWTGTRHDQSADVSEKQIYLSPVDVEKEFSEIERWESMAEERFQSHPVVRITYEDLVDQPVESFTSIVAFLGLQYTDPASEFHRQNPEELSELIANFDELREYFAYSRWNTFFDK